MTNFYSVNYNQWFDDVCACHQLSPEKRFRIFHLLILTSEFIEPEELLLRRYDAAYNMEFFQ